jgi:hypothetical protein
MALASGFGGQVHRAGTRGALRQFRSRSRGDREAVRRYFAAAAAYFLRNLSTRPAVSTIFCLPV